MATRAIKFCKDCKHYRRMFEMCAHPSITPDRVTGRSAAAAEYMRWDGECGLEAKLFELGPPDFEVKAKQISRTSSRDALLILAGIVLLAGSLAYLVVVYTR